MDTGEQVAQEVAEICGHLNHSYARLVEIVADALIDESWAIGGIRSPQHWLTMRAGLSPFRARQVVSVAKRRAELPTVMAEFAAGQLSMDQVIVVARYAPAHVEASVAELAVNATVPQLSRALSHYSFDPPAEDGHHQQKTKREAAAADPPSAEAQDATSAEARKAAAADAGAGEPETDNPKSTDAPSGGVASAGTGSPADAGVAAGASPSWNGLGLADDRSTAPAELSMSHDQWGRFTLRFTAPADLGALVEAALKEARDALFRAGRPEVTWADALIEIARRSMGAVESIN
ncbi:MAG: hypothetical protein QOE58_616, partial [Actinomycetota bacterium]|nr:hypothetical protein [Actinomycetota bacterium]